MSMQEGYLNRSGKATVSEVPKPGTGTGWQCMQGGSEHSCGQRVHQLLALILVIVH